MTEQKRTQETSLPPLASIFHQPTSSLPSFPPTNSTTDFSSQQSELSYTTNNATHRQLNSAQPSTLHRPFQQLAVSDNENEVNHQRRASERLTLLPICKTSSNCKTRIKICNGRVFLKRRTIYKTTLERPTRLTSPSPFLTDHSITSVCYQYYEVPFSSDLSSPPPSKPSFDHVNEDAANNDNNAINSGDDDDDDETLSSFQTPPLLPRILLSSQH